MKVDKWIFSNSWKDKRDRTIEGREKRASILALESKPVGQPVLTIIGLMSKHPERFKVEVHRYGSMAQFYKVTDMVTLFQYSVGVAHQEYRDSDYFNDYVPYVKVGMSTEGLDWATPEEVHALAMEAVRVEAAQHRIAYEEARKEKEDRVNNGRNKVMELYNLEG